MAYALPNDPILKSKISNLPAALLNYESGVSESDSLETIRVKMILARDYYAKVIPKPADAGLFNSNFAQSVWSFNQADFLTWQVFNRLSPAKLDAFKNYNNSVVASKTGGITDDFTGFIDRTNIIEIGAAAVLVATGAAAVGTIAGASAGSALALPTITAPAVSLPSAGQIIAAGGAAVTQELEKRASAEIKNILAPVQQPPPVLPAQQPQQSAASAESKGRAQSVLLISALIGAVLLLT